jgi:hypothetical protein
MFKPDHRCENCRYWDIHSLGARKGDCRAPGDHRYYRVPMTDKAGNVTSYAPMDSFGREETGPNFTCGAWDSGSSPFVLKVD